MTETYPYKEMRRLVDSANSQYERGIITSDEYTRKCFELLHITLNSYEKCAYDSAKFFSWHRRLAKKLKVMGLSYHEILKVRDTPTSHIK